eukprot:FR743591.1.p1 GENE.FR743591.1~~FR743591.1.p1  ORF type:complete len:248 (+),score=17.24 FR743591.1:89-832(+)
MEAIRAAPTAACRNRTQQEQWKHGLSENGRGANTSSSSSTTVTPPPSATAVLNPEDMVAAASDAVDFLLSSKGSKVRTELVADTITFTATAADESVQSMTTSKRDRYDAGFEGSEVNSAGDSSTELRNHEGGGQATDAKTGSSTRTNINNRSRGGVGGTIADHLRRLGPATTIISDLVSIAPGPWIGLMTRTALHPMAHVFAGELTRAVVKTSGWRAPQLTLLSMSKAMHKRRSGRSNEDQDGSIRR